MLSAAPHVAWPYSSRAEHKPPRWSKLLDHFTAILIVRVWTWPSAPFTA